MAFFVLVKIRKAPLSLTLTEIKRLLYVQSLYYIKQIDSMLPCNGPVTYHRRRQNVVITSVTHSAIASCATFLFLLHFDVLCDLLLDRCTATWNLFVNYIITQVILAFWLVLSYDLLEDRCTIDVIITKIFPLCFKMAESVWEFRLYFTWLGKR